MHKCVSAENMRCCFMPDFDLPIAEMLNILSVCALKS